MSNEEFFKNLNIENTISNLKLRVGWGQNGNQRIDRDAPLTLIGTNKDVYKRQPLLAPKDLKAGINGMEITCLLNPGVFK